METLYKFKYILILLIFALSAFSLNAQVDSLIFFNGNYIVGSVKNMNRGVLTVETDFSDSDFKIEWEGIKEVYTATYFLITLSDGRRYNGHINSAGSDKIIITTNDGSSVEVIADEIVWLEDVDKGFWSQLYASIDIGFDITKANNFQQASMQSTVGYLAERWNLDASYNTLYSSQDETENIRRTDGGIGYKYFLPKDWYPLVSLNFLSNTEQKLELRTTGKMGFGKYVIHTNRTYWGFSVGTNYNNENFAVDSIPDSRSWEGFLGSELNLFDIGNLSLFAKIIAYPGITIQGRLRTDFNVDAKYEMPFDDDFYIKFGVTVNYDNKPIAGASETDYILYSGFGWSW